MIKSAIFVEGLTERIFVKKLIYKKYINERNVIVKEMVLKGKDKFFEPLDYQENQGVEIFFLIVEV